MQSIKGQQKALSYLDVSQYIIKQTSPLIKPSSPQHPPYLEATTLKLLQYYAQSLSSLQQIIQSYRLYQTPEIQPIDHDTTQFLLTPLNKYLRLEDMSDFIDDFSLDTLKPNANETKKKTLKNSDFKTKAIQNQASQLFLLECDLQKIVEVVEEDEQLQLQSSDLSQDSGISQDQSQVHERYEDVKIVQGNSFSIKSHETNLRDTEEQKHTIFQLSPVDYTEIIAKFSNSPKTQILKAIKELESQSQSMNPNQRIHNLKKCLEPYLLQFQTFCHEEAWNKLTGDFNSILRLIRQGIQQTFSRKIGPIDFEQRRLKLLKYLEKKKTRICRKKVSYDSRKKVADGRLRIKGKFINRSQACEQLGVENLDHYSPQQIKQMLQRRIDSLGQHHC